jgi:hypothetical protein
MIPAAADRIAVKNRLKPNDCSRERSPAETVEPFAGGKTAELKCN